MQGSAQIGSTHCVTPNPAGVHCSPLHAPTISHVLNRHCHSPTTLWPQGQGYRGCWICEATSTLGCPWPSKSCLPPCRTRHPPSVVYSRPTLLTWSWIPPMLHITPT